MVSKKFNVTTSCIFISFLIIYISLSEHCIIFSFANFLLDITPRYCQIWYNSSPLINDTLYTEVWTLYLSDHFT
ncbi:hypothetical protein C1645_768261 [Glomus cerebriforme]|uniref:Uncharacterized protein n=1 Tax=Glomus cerebriforme TaxID=658196 RepID=A0A397SYJ6_9GLOM|nr:hypothetical protein C1645_768261 [Glomus cerebriforme]